MISNLNIYTTETPGYKIIHDINRLTSEYSIHIANRDMIHNTSDTNHIHDCRMFDINNIADAQIQFIEIIDLCFDAHTSNRILDEVRGALRFPSVLAELGFISTDAEIEFNMKRAIDKIKATISKYKNINTPIKSGYPENNCTSMFCSEFNFHKYHSEE